MSGVCSTLVNDIVTMLLHSSTWLKRVAEKGCRRWRLSDRRTLPRGILWDPFRVRFEIETAAVVSTKLEGLEGSEGSKDAKGVQER